MYRVMIVDDEPYAVEFIVEILSGMPELDVYKAYSAEDALEQLTQARMDIVFTDMMMPGMDGLELTQRLQALWPEAWTVILTGHGTFDTMYRSQKLDRVRYLVKTESSDTILDTVRQVIREIEESARRSELEIEARTQAMEFTRLKQQEYLLSLLENRVQEPPGKEVFAELSLDLDPDAPVFAVAARYNAGCSPVRAAETVCRSAAPRYRTAYVLLDSTRTLFLIQPREEITDAEKERNALEGTLELAQNRCFESLHGTAFFAASRELCPVAEIGVMVNRLLLLLRGENGDTERILWTRTATQPRTADLVKEVAALEDLFAGRDRKGFEDRLYMLLQTARELPFLEGCQVYYALLSSMIRIVAVSGLGQPRELDALIALRPLSWDECGKVLAQLTEYLFTAPGSDPKTRLIEEIESFVRANLDFSLSLVRIASEFHYNPSYLSRLYRQVRGDTLQNYIIGEKIRRAKDLLRDPKLRLSDIADKLGYETVTYFCFMFKKMTGNTPQEYRILHTRR